MLDRSQLPLAVCHADVSPLGFHFTADYFQNLELNRNWWMDVRTLAHVIAPLTLAERAFVIVEGDVLADLTLRDGAAVIYGDLRSSIQAAGQCELVVAGDVCEGATIFGDGILRVFVGGDVVGCLRSCRSCKAWIEGNLRGDVWTGHPSTELLVLGDCSAKIRPSEKPALLYLEVGGFMAYASLEATAAVGYTQFKASVGRSDRPAGLYPDKNVREALREHRSYNRWVIRNTAGPADSNAR